MAKKTNKGKPKASLAEKGTAGGARAPAEASSGAAAKKQAGAKQRRAQKAEEAKRRKEQQELVKQRRIERERQLAKENSEAYEAMMRRRRRWKRSRRRHSYILILILLGIVGAILCFRMFLSISDIRVIGESRYNDDELILSSGLKIGDHLYDFDPDVVAKEIQDGHVYLESVTVKRVLPTTVEILVAPVLETGVVQGETGFSIISSGGKVLETGVLYPPAELPLITGLQLSVDQSDLEKVNQLDKRLETLSALNAGLTASKFTGVTAIDLTDMLNITIVYQDRVKINLGDNDKLNEKIALVAKALEEVDPAKQGTMDASIDKKVFFHEESIHPEYRPATPAEPEVPADGDGGMEDGGTEKDGNAGEAGSTSSSQSSSASSQIPQIPPSPNIA